ncbi:MAG TPA: zinc metalloprotease HtpX [Solirubrobacteraceae bacterium]|jgi:heat shock protein HtpX|nr:zinc metalloprotease HtpX [Solirubrobacteraceae bacterium]
MNKTRNFGRDPGLQARMMLTLFLLGLVYAVLIGVLFAAGVGAVTIAVIAGGLFLIQFFTSDRIALASLGAREIAPGDGPGAAKLMGVVQRLAIQADIPMPRVAVADTPMPNAFAVGRSPKSATVCVTTGLLSLLEDGELEAVLGHELTHIANRDVMVMTLASFFASIASFIVQMGFWFGGAFGDDEDGGPSALVVILVSGLVYVVSWLLLQALSRYREFAADRGSAVITGRPSALISALMKIESSMGRIPQRDLRAASGELAAFYIFPPQVKQSVTTLFSTHPSLEQRISALQRLEVQLQASGRAASLR